MRSHFSVIGVKATNLADNTFIDSGIPIAFDAHKVIIAGQNIDSATNRAANANGLGVFDLESSCPR